MSTWTEPMIARASGMWIKGDSAGTIARAFGVTRNAVIGVVARNRDQFPPRRAGETVNVELVRARRAKAKEQTPAKIGRPPKPPAPPVKKSVFEDVLDGPAPTRDLNRFRLPDRQPVAFADLTAGQCKFIFAGFDDVCGPNTPCCGAETADFSPWCVPHQRVVFKVRAA